jgi:hypothetical protein
MLYKSKIDSRCPELLTPPGARTSANIVTLDGAGGTGRDAAHLAHADAGARGRSRQRRHWWIAAPLRHERRVRSWGRPGGGRQRVFKFVRRAPASFRPVQRGSSSRPPVPAQSASARCGLPQTRVVKPSLVTASYTPHSVSTWMQRRLGAPLLRTQRTPGTVSGAAPCLAPSCIATNSLRSAHRSGTSSVAMTRPAARSRCRRRMEAG